MFPLELHWDHNQINTSSLENRDEILMQTMYSIKHAIPYWIMLERCFAIEKDVSKRYVVIGN